MYCMLTYHKLRHTRSSNEIFHKVDYRSCLGFNITLLFLFRESDIVAAIYNIITVRYKLVHIIRRSRPSLISVMFEINYAVSL